MMAATVVQLQHCGACLPCARVWAKRCSSCPPHSSAFQHKLFLTRSPRYSLVLSAGGSSHCDGPLIDMESVTQAVGCAAEMVTLAAWGVGRASALADAARHEDADAPDVFKKSAALARGLQDSCIGILIGSSSVRECHVPAGCDPSVWLALSGGHWRVITNHPRLVALPPTPILAPPPFFPAIQFDGLPRSKTRSSFASITFVTVAHEISESAAAPAPPPLPAAAAPPPLASIIGRREVCHGGDRKVRQLHVVWEKGHVAQAANPHVSVAGHELDKW